MSAAISTISVACLAAGAFFSIVGCLGLVRMPGLFPRMHAASVTDTLGAGLLIIGLLLDAGVNLIGAKLLLLGVLILLTNPTATHALAQAALARDPELLHARDGA